MQVSLSKYQKSLFYEIFILEEYKCLKSVIKSSNIIFDVGSNIGLFSLYVFSLQYNFEVKMEGNNLLIPDNICLLNTPEIHLFEPNGEIFQISQNILAKFGALTRPNNFGLTNIAGTSLLMVPEIDCQGSIFESFLTKKHTRILLAQFQRLDDYIEKNNISSIDLLKMDIEGAEFDLLGDLQEKYFQNIKVLFLEYHILEESFRARFENLLNKLKSTYSHVEITEGKYNKNIGYIICHHYET